MAHVLVIAGVGFRLGAIEGHMPQAVMCIPAFGTAAGSERTDYC